MNKNTTDILGLFRKLTKRMFTGVGRSAQPNTRLGFESLEDRTVPAASFFAPTEPAGTVNVKLVPLGNVAAGTQEMVTFGVPFTRGSVTQTQLSQLRVLKNGVEIPAFVEQLTPWRSIDDPAIDGQSVRVARVQIPYTFSSLNPESVTVQWGGPARTLTLPSLQNPRQEWHTVTSGTFVAADNVEEPDVLPVLPKEYLSKGMLDARTDPTSGNVAETRDDPTVMDSASFNGYQEFDYAQKNFFYTTINQNPGITINYKTDPEPWLYDRPSSMYSLYLRSGFTTALREAVRATDFYADRLNASGSFSLKPGDPKYSYNEALAYTYWLLGDNRMLAPISTVVSAHNGTASRWNPNLSFWTERNVGYKLLANQMAYEVTGAANFKANVQTIVGDLIYHQNGANGQLPANRVDGGLYHTGAQHDISEASSASVLIASSWMSTLIVDPMVRAFGVWQNSQISDFVIRMGNFEKAASKTDANGQFGGTTRYPDYLMRTDGTSDNRTSSDVQHAMDVGAVAAWATYFAELRGTPDASLRQLANDLYATYDTGVNFWTRPGGTNFNVSPPRRYTWEYKNSASFSWALTGTDAPGQPGTLRFSVAGYSVNENGGTATITVTRTGGSSGSVSVNYATSNGTATAGSDYTATSGTLSFADGEMTRTFTIAITNDALLEGNETINLTLSNPTGGANLGSPATAVLTIQDDDAAQPGVIQFSTTAYTVNEAQGTITITVTRTGGSNVPVSVNYATSNGTATAGSDYTSTSGTLTFGVGETTKTFTIPIINDTAIESPETVTLTLSNPTNGATLGNPSTATLTINSDDTTGQPTTTSYQQGVNGYTGTTDVTISTQYAQYTGGNGTTTFNGTQLGAWETTGSGSYVIQSLIRFADLGIPASAVVSWATLTLSVDTWSANPIIRGYYLLAPWSGTPGSSTTQLGWLRRGDGSNWNTSGGRGQGTDVIAGKSFQLPGIAASGQQTITIQLDPEVVQAWVSNPNANQGILLVSESPGAIVRINASEHATVSVRPKLSVTYTSVTTPLVGAIQFSGATYSVNENGGVATISVTRTGGSAGAVTVNYSTSNGTATAGSDYASTSGTLTFADGETTKTFTIPITNDTLFEGNETINLTLSGPTGGATLGNQATAVLTIQDDDNPPLPPPPPPPSGSFTNVTISSGVGAIIDQMSQTNPNWWMTGQHLVDLDTDGDLDLVLDSHGGGNAVVVLNNGQGVFTRVNPASFPTTEIHEMFDINGDGKIDLNVTYQDGGSQWWLNNSTPGNVNFTATNVTRGGNTSRGQVMFDFNGDGKVDWFRSAPPGLVVDFGNGAGGFTEGSLTFPIAGTTSNENANFLPGDFDGDGKTDLLVLTGGGYDGTMGKTAVWRNNGNLTFSDVTAGSGLPTAGFLVKGIGDFDHDGDLDVIGIQNKSMPPRIYLNNGQGQFTLKANAISGVGAGTLDYAFWGTAVTTDFDNDGIADIIMNGKYYLKVLRGTGGGNFTYMNTAWGIKDTAASAVDDGLCFGDIDGDGDLDIVGFNDIYPNRTLNVYRNDLAQQNWLNIRPVGPAGNVGAAGAKISIYMAGTNQLLWFEQVAQYSFQVATSYYGTAETERHFGLGSRTAVDVVVEFPDGRVVRMNNVAANQTIRVPHG